MPTAEPHTEKLQFEIIRYSKLNGYEATKFDSLICSCNHTDFKLFSDDVEGGCSAECLNCNQSISVCESADYMEEVLQNICNCGNESLQIITGLAFYEDSTDIRWIYVGASCQMCNLVGVYVDWNEH